MRASSFQPHPWSRTLIANFLNYPARVADCDSVRWNVSHEYTPGSDHVVVADGHTGTNDTMPPKPDIVPDVNGFCRPSPLLRISGSTGWRAVEI